ncbi:MAG TPA: SDR family oxidoreductase [Ktedonobacterales bacterium]|nr:SDR family oxidoreductase [Ktedonobacterales bacterium]
MSQTPTIHNPLDRGPKPPFPEQSQPPTGSEKEMQPRPDYGEQTYKGAGKLQGRAAIITGGDSGIGRAVALAYAREGADVLFAYLEEDADAEETTRITRDSGRKIIAMKGDVADEAFCGRLIDRAQQEFGRIDILVNNAAYQQTHKSITEMPSDEIERIFRTNVLALFWLCKAAIPHMQPGGVIINTASIEAYQPKPVLLHYAASKGAIVTFTKGLALELTPKGIRVNAVAPGPVWTPLIPMSMPPEEVKNFGKSDPMQRPAQPAELAPAYVFLASDDASYISGEILGVTGGKTLP